MEQIFISYSRADKDFVDSLARDLESYQGGKFDCWTDRADISGGDDWNKAISRAIRNCSYFLLVLSPKSAGSMKVGQELSLADKHNKRIIPLMYQTCDIPEELELLLTRPQIIDFTQGHEEAFQKLCVALGQKPPVGTTPTPTPAAGAPNPNWQPNYPQPTYPPPPPPPPNLMQIVPGQWFATATYPMMQITARVWMQPNGSFQAQQLPMGSSVQGRWSVDHVNNIHLQGVETNGYMSAPFAGGLRVMTFDRNQITGIGPLGEQVYWRREV